jgi:hypothetical protein
LKEKMRNREQRQKTRDLSRVVKERIFLQSGNFHLCLRLFGRLYIDFVSYT